MKVLLEVRNLRKYFPVKKKTFRESRQYVHALEDISFDLREGETLGVVGESGSGKSTLGRVILRLETPTDGTITYDGNDVTSLSGKDLRAFRECFQMVFQDPYSSLNPRLTVGNAIAEPMRIHGKVRSHNEAKSAVSEMLLRVGLQPEMANLYPHSFSGGQRQRIGIARALSLGPKVLICDEAVSALDVSVQSQVLNLFNRLKRELNLTYIFIAHDLSVVRYISDRIMVMYLGQIMELAPKEQLFETMYHPYTESLISASPEPSTKTRKGRIILKGEVPSSLNPPKGCRFHTRCFKEMPICSETEPELREVAPGHFVRCHLCAEKGRG
ncbi:ABC transporter ATP-binding protein [Breznakiella homolactica]|uniref:ABC transporter ATP-binding protein n=1 Tax=Breznakiella homolactica TaxID=2798577 RepID=UPI001CBA60A2|nr:oligopeptide/dipeptide ABC transporter ATP-binding protein [Breznakiella homolactica]